MKILNINVNGQKIEELPHKDKSVYFSGYVNIEYKGELCTEETHGLKIFHRSSILEKFAEKFVHLVWKKEEKKYYLEILSLSKYNDITNSVTAISWEEYQDDYCYGPKSKIYFKITKGKHKNEVCACDLKIHVPTFDKTSGVKRIKNGVKDTIEQKEFCFFGNHPSSDFLYGYMVKQKDFGGKCVYIFNLNNKLIQSVAYKSSATKPAQATHLRNMIYKVQEKLTDSIEEYNNNVSGVKFVDGDAERRCGEGLDFHLHTCFKYLIEDHIIKFFNAGK